MAAVPATITVSFTSNYAGPHRVCYRINNSGTYTCATVTCTGGGATCSYDIGITVDNETCEDVIFDGYVQASCNDISSEDGRVAFLSTFTPTPSCTKYTVTCNYAGLGVIDLFQPGSGYDPNSPPSVSFTGGGGSGATAVAVVGDGVITGIADFTDGAGYVDGTYTNVPLNGGSGTGAQATLTITTGILTSVTITAPGVGYLTGEILTPDPTAMGPSTPTTDATVTVNTNYGILQAINLTSPGSGYSSGPTVVIAAGSGTQAQASVGLGYCDEFFSAGCGNSGIPISYANMLIPGGSKSSIALCSSGSIPTVGAQYSLVADGNCLCECTNYTLEPTGTDAIYSYIYTTCDGETVTGTVEEGGSPSTVTFCAVTNSLIYRFESGSPFIDVTTGDC